MWYSVPSMAVEGSDIVINLIGKHYQTKHILPWWINYTYDDVHVDVARTIAEVAKEAGVPRMVHVSSLLAQPNSPSEWAASKFRGEVAVRKAFPEANIVRPSNMFGPEDRLLVWMARVRERRGEGHLPHHAGRAIQGKTFEFVGDEEFTYKELADYVFDITKQNSRLVNLPLPVAQSIGYFCEQFPDPKFTRDWATRLSLNEVKTSDLPGLRELDVEPTKLEKEAPNFMIKFNPGGHFQEALTVRAQHFQGLITVSQTHGTHGAVNSSLNSSRSTRQGQPMACSALQVATAGRRCFATDTSDTLLYFDTHNVVKSLQGKGASSAGLAGDSVRLYLRSVARFLNRSVGGHSAGDERRHGRLIGGTSAHHIAQRHSRELLERDFNTLKQDIRMLEKIDFDKIRMEIAELEKKFLLQKQAEDETLNELRLSMEKVEKRMLQYAVGFAGTIMAVGAALMRLVL
ncbi:Coiled-coil domain-containing protein 90-like [Phytophthora cactorum]|nr:Coiled-coil domain-containing protein 90-like [Phytophthora cactorum]